VVESLPDDAEAVELLDVRRAAVLAERHPETVRRWVWSGRLRARRQGNRLLVARRDVEALAAESAQRVLSLAAWADRARAALEQSTLGGPARSAADLVTEDRRQRSDTTGARAGR